MYHVCRFINLGKGQAGASGYIEDNAARTLDSGFQQRRCNRLFRSIHRTVFTGARAYAHMSYALILHNGFYIGKVKVYKRLLCNKLGNSRYALTQNIIGLTERFDYRSSLTHHLKQLVIRNDYKAVHPRFKLRNAFFRMIGPYLAFKHKRTGNNAHSKNAHFLGNLRNAGSGAGTCSAAHSGRNKHHVSPFELLGNILSALLCGLFSYFGICSGTQTLCKLCSYLNLFAGP